mmetsp:Transcript_28264/g.89870  ORF Transcript_28264/g.89870 Transcript_28264/m.89870 type:complete len:241 (-) Transcript_28264:1423-2145(-)
MPVAAAPRAPCPGNGIRDKSRAAENCETPVLMRSTTGPYEYSECCVGTRGIALWGVVTRGLAASGLKSCWLFRSMLPDVCDCTKLKYSPCLPMSSACGPYSTTEPLLKTKMTSAFLMVERRCATEITVRPASAEPCSLSRVPWTWLSESLSRAEVASSSSSTCGRLANARAMAMRCFWPPDIWQPAAPTKVSRPFGIARRKLKMCACSAALSTCSSVMLASPPRMFSRAEVAKSTGSWPT